MNLKNLSNQHLISDLKGLVVQERELLTQLLHYLREVQQRRLYLGVGYGSLYSFVREELGYSEAAAVRRIQAMRLIQELPEVETKISSGEISLSVASRLQGFIQKEEKHHKETVSKNKPRPDQKPAKALSRGDKLQLIHQMAGASSRECERTLAALSPEAALPKDKTRFITKENIQVSFTAGKEVLNKIERLKTLTFHQNPQGKLEKLFEKALDMALEKLDPEKREARRVKRSKATAPTSECPSPITRNIPQKIRDSVWLRDQGRCQFQDKKTGKTCRSQYMLELDHAFPFSLGGDHSLENLRLHCQAHNLHRARFL